MRGGHEPAPAGGGGTNNKPRPGCAGCGCAILTAILVFGLLSAITSLGDDSPPALSIDTNAALDEIIEQFRLNFGQTSWYESVEQIELTITGDTAGLTVQTSLYPKASNEQPARAICVGLLTLAQDTTQAPRVNVIVKGEGDNRLLSCHIEPGQAIRWQVYSALKK